MAKNNTCKPDQKPNQQSKQIVEQAVFVAEWVAKVLTVAEQLRLKTKVVDTFVPEKLERTVLATLPTVPAKVRNKMNRGETAFTAAEVCGMALAVAEELPEAGPQEQVGLLMVARTLMDGLQTWIADTGEAKLAKKPTKSKAAYQFKITLSDSEPPIWRRIQVEDCTLDELHGHIQTAMGWTNSHLHYFEIGGKRFGDPELLEDAGFAIADSTRTRLSKILPADGKRFRFVYEYDFGDDWRHEVLFEGCPQAEKGSKFPVCLEGERACPPEDCGGLGGYEHFLEVIADPQHEDYDDMVEWIGGKFDPETFDSAKATQAMKQGLPDWRSADEDDVF